MTPDAVLLGQFTMAWQFTALTAPLVANDMFASRQTLSSGSLGAQSTVYGSTQGASLGTCHFAGRDCTVTARVSAGFRPLQYRKLIDSEMPVVVIC